MSSIPRLSKEQVALLAAVRHIEQTSPSADATAAEISRLLPITLQAVSRAAGKLVERGVLHRGRKTPGASVAYTTTHLGQQILGLTTANNAANHEPATPSGPAGPDEPSTAGATETDIEILVLPGSRLQLQWRAGQSWRVLTDQQASATDPDEVNCYDQDWAIWTGDQSVLASYVEAGDPWKRDDAHWAVYGQLPTDGAVPTVTTIDGRSPKIHVLGRIWASEWTGPAVDATVIRAGHIEQLIPLTRRPAYLPR